MAKRVQVVLTESISSLGKDGDVVDVAPGYARNFLFPTGKAANVTPSVLKQIERKREKEKIAAEKIKKEALDFKTALKTIGRFTIKKQVGEDGVLFGTVTNGDVAEAIKVSTKKEVDRRDIQVPDIHTLGSYTVQIKLHQEVSAEVNIEVTSSNICCIFLKISQSIYLSNLKIWFQSLFKIMDLMQVISLKKIIVMKFLD